MFTAITMCTQGILTPIGVDFTTISITENFVSNSLDFEFDNYQSKM